ncbi:MAG: lactoylglutathione lyase [Burkholderiales bacterium]|jgi:lactoylglutathione lyase|nr:lactoylglutathione lyase [Burkholderiales bacterium]
MDYELDTAARPEQRLDLAERPTRILHAMLRVFDLQRSLDFYIGALGMQLIRRQDYPGGRFTLAFLGYGAEESNTVLELTHNWDQPEPYAMGTAYGHIAIAVNDIYATCAELAEAGVNLTRAPGPMKHSATLIAFIEDPDGYKIELIQRD